MRVSSVQIRHLSAYPFHRHLGQILSAEPAAGANGAVASGFTLHPLRAVAHAGVRPAKHDHLAGHRIKA